MPIKLKTDEDYYSRKVEYEGTTIQIRELNDDALEQFGALQDALKAHAEKAVTEHGGDIAVMRAKLALIDMDDMEAVQRAMNEVGDGMPMSVQVALIQEQRGIVDHVCVHGVADWDIPGTDCTPEAVPALPNHVKLGLATQIIKDTVMSDVDAAFLAKPQ